MALASRESLTIGPVHAITQNTVYALPARSLKVHSLAAIDISVDASTWVTVAASTTGTEIGSAFIRCSSTNTSLTLRAL